MVFVRKGSRSHRKTLGIKNQKIKLVVEREIEREGGREGGRERERGEGVRHRSTYSTG